MNITRIKGPQVIFHGGCNGCTRQDSHGVDGCFDCQFFDADWNKPDLNNRPPDREERLRKDIKSRRRLTLL